MTGNLDSSLPSEQQMFRVVVGVGLALVPVLILSVVAGPGWAAILLGFEIGVGIGVLWRHRRARSARAPDGPAGPRDSA